MKIKAWLSGNFELFKEKIQGLLYLPPPPGLILVYNFPRTLEDKNGFLPFPNSSLPIMHRGHPSHHVIVSPAREVQPDFLSSPGNSRCAGV